MRRLIATGVFTILFSSFAHAQEPVKLTLAECMDYAMKHNYTMKNAQLDVEIQAAQIKETTAAALPHVNGRVEFDDYLVPQRTYFPTGSFGAFFVPFLTPLYTATGTQAPPATGGSEYSAIQISPQYSGTASASLSQTLFDGSLLVALKARKAVMVLASQGRDVTEENIRYNVYKAYNSLVIAYRQFAITKEALRFSRNIEHDIIVTQQNGMAEKIDVERTSVQVNNLATDSIRIGNMLTTSEQLLKYNIGMDIATPIVLIDTDLDARRAAVLRLMEEQKNYDKVPDYRLYKAQLTLNEYNLKRYQEQAYPTLSLLANGGYNYASQNLYDFEYGFHYLSYAMVGLQLNVPIFNGFLRTNQVREAKLNIEKSKNNIENEKLTIDFQDAQSRTSMKNAVVEVQSQHRNMDLANDVLDLAQRKYKAGVGSNLEVTQAQTDQLRAQTNYFNSLLDLINSEADLRKALGLLK